MQWLIEELNWLKEILGQYQQKQRLQLNAPLVSDNQSLYGKFISDHNLGAEERLLLILTLCPYLSPGLLSSLVADGNPNALVQYSKTGLLLPSGETWLQLVSGGDAALKIQYSKAFDTTHIFYKKGVIDLGTVDEGVPATHGIIKMAPAYREQFLYNRTIRPRYSNDFPAHLLETSLAWDDLVLNAGTLSRLSEIRHYLKYESLLRSKLELNKHMKPGYKCLFHGPSGTGKTQVAALLGKEVNREVYRIDISAVVSKYVGETAKNLNALFNTAEDKDWILFFDEGDALFGKRTDTAKSDDKNLHFANQEVAFLLQRIENFNGLVIVATNFKQNVDDAFARRFQNTVLFNIPDAASRLLLWQKNIPTALKLESNVSLEQLSNTHPLSAASIIKVISRVALLTISSETDIISRGLIERCIMDENM